jgi:hypothetical protein
MRAKGLNSISHAPEILKPMNKARDACLTKALYGVTRDSRNRRNGSSIVRFGSR